MSTLAQRTTREVRRMNWPGILLTMLFCASLLYASVVWAGLLRVPNLGGVVARSTTNVGVLDWGYRTLGSALLAVPGAGALAQSYVERHFADRFAPMLEQPESASALFLSSPSGAGQALRWAHFGTPWLFALLVLATLLRPRRPGTFGTQR